MTTPAAADLKPARLRLWSNWLWMLAAILGAALLWSSVRLIHDQQARREALRSLAQDKATEIANLGAARFTLLVSNAFAPIWDDRLSNPRLVVAELANAHLRGQTCRCREVLPITRFFRFDGGSAPLTSGAPTVDDGIADSTLLRISRRQLDEATRSPTSIRDVDVLATSAVVTITRPARGGSAATVYGAVMPVAGLAAALFGGFPRDVPAGIGAPVIASGIAHLPEAHIAHLQMHRRLVRVDTIGLGVSAGSRPIFGSVPDRPYVGTVALPEPLSDFRVYVSLMGSHVAVPLAWPPPHDRLWLNGVLILATIVVCVFAVGASRREVALARARSDFVAGISHDLRMPLAQILLASETLSLGRERGERDRSTLVASILREARRLKAMVDNVLLFSRSGAVGLQPNLQPLDTRAVLDAVAESVGLALADAGQTIDIQANDPARMVADRALIHQALVNLVDNAMKYGPTGQTIRLHAIRSGRVVQLTIEDDGPGIPAAARQRLFEPYERLARDSSSERTGSGLGLAVVRQIVLACKGTVRIEDAPRGARVVIELPAA